MIRGLGLLRLALTECEEETRSRNRLDLVQQSALWVRNLPRTVFFSIAVDRLECLRRIRREAEL